MSKIEQQKIQKAKALVVALEEGVNGHYLSGDSVPCHAVPCMQNNIKGEGGNFSIKCT